MMHYRPHIDGLRAIAISLVLIYHGRLSFFPSGFIGVDIFFVISGFLITKIIIHELQEANFSFIHFYNRRLWRLQPVFLVFLLVSTALALLFFLPNDLVNYSKSVRKAALFVANIFFNRTTTGYFIPDTQQLPLLHTWSLSIEWQCYLILPLILYGLHQLFKTYFEVIVYLLTFVFFLVALYFSQTMPAQNYYLFFSRFFEFLVGSCVVFISVRPETINQVALTILIWSALVTLFFIASEESLLLGYPDYHALIICLCTAALILSGEFFPNHHLMRILSWRPLVFIGLLSYSLYLWHWLVFSFLRYQDVTETWGILLGAYGGSFFIAYLSWRYVEKPSRHFKIVKFHYSTIVLLFLPLLLIHGFSQFVKTHQGFPQRFNQELVEVYQQLEQYRSEQRPLCISSELEEPHTKCLLGARKTPHKHALLIGDSFANHYWGFMDVLGQDAEVSILAQGISSCLTLPGIHLYDWWHFKNKTYQACYEKTQFFYQLLQQQPFDFVIIGQNWGNYLAASVINELGDERSLGLAKKRVQRALDQALSLITATGAKPVLIKTSALMEHDAHECFLRHIKLRQPYQAKECQFKLEFSAAEHWFDTLFDKMKNKYSNLILIDPKSVQCHQGWCEGDIQGVPIYRDAGHLTDYASYQLGKRYLKQFPNPLLEG